MPVDEALRTLWALIASYALSVLGGIAILIVGWVVAGWAGRATHRVLHRIPRIDGTLIGFVSSLVRYGVLALVGGGTARRGAATGRRVRRAGGPRAAGGGPHAIALRSRASAEVNGALSGGDSHEHRQHPRHQG